ncbi:MAG: hypothetical protein FJX54_21820 [Alphaproteobacteria bacterium]|nr:hypothetical protein [Alphaproteobacteria bacterium]
MSEPSRDETQALAAEGARAREELNRRLQTSLDLGRAVRFQPSTRWHGGAWNLFLAGLGGAILVAIVIVNVWF